MGPMVWKVLGTVAAGLAAAVASRVVSKGWEVASGHPAPDDPTNPEDFSWKESLAFAAISGLAISVARVAATRRAAEYYAQSAGHLPAAMREIDETAPEA